MNDLPIVVLDSSVVVGGIGWAGGESRQVLVRLALGSFGSRYSHELAREWSDALAATAAEEPRWRNANWSAGLDWLRRASRAIEPAQLGRTVKRDPADDVVLAVAVGAKAAYLATLDKDLLSLGKPWGVHILTPRALLAELA